MLIPDSNGGGQPLGLMRPQPIDHPLPVLQIAVFTSRLQLMTDGRWNLRYMPMTLVGPGEWGPNADHHVELLMQESTIANLVEQVGLHGSPEFKQQLRVALSDVDVPPKPKLVLPGDQP